MKRKTRENIKTVSMSFLKILAMGTAVTVVGMLSQGRTADKLVKGLWRYAAWEIKEMIKKMKVQRLVVYDEQDEHSPIVLTEKGFLRLTKENIKTIKGKKWDHFWRIVLFDIPERIGTRRSFQQMLRYLGFYKIQKSIYVYPFDCKSDVVRLAANYGVCRYVTVLTVPHLDNHEQTVRNFYFNKSNRKLVQQKNLR